MQQNFGCRWARIKGLEAFKDARGETELIYLSEFLEANSFSTNYLTSFVLTVVTA